MVPMSTSEAVPHIARKFADRIICIAPVDHQAVLFGSSSISIWTSVVAISMAAKLASRLPTEIPRIRYIQGHIPDISRYPRGVLSLFPAPLCLILPPTNYYSVFALCFLTSARAFHVQRRAGARPPIFTISARRAGRIRAARARRPSWFACCYPMVLSGCAGAGPRVYWRASVR